MLGGWSIHALLVLSWTKVHIFVKSSSSHLPLSCTVTVWIGESAHRTGVIAQDRPAKQGPCCVKVPQCSTNQLQDVSNASIPRAKDRPTTAVLLANSPSHKKNLNPADLISHSKLGWPGQQTPGWLFTLRVRLVMGLCDKAEGTLGES